MSVELKSIEITVNGYLYHGDLFKDEVMIDKATLQGHLEEMIKVLHERLKAEDFQRLEGKRPENCPVCQEDIQDAGKKELPPYRDWECKFCSMNGHDGRFQLKDR